MWSGLPEVAQEFIYDHGLPLKIAHVDDEYDLPEREIRVAGIARRDDEMLFIRSCKDGREWEFPGGRLEDGESPDDAVHREFNEETGLTVTDSEPLMALVWAFQDSTITQIVFQVDVKGEVTDPDETEVCGIDWFETLPENISFGAAGTQTYEIIINSEPVSDDSNRFSFDLQRVTDKKSIAVGSVVAGGAVAAGLTRRLLSNND